MTSSKNISSYEEAIYAVKRGFLIIGLTGYTGSGCSTARNLLESAYKIVIPSYTCMKKLGLENELTHSKLTRIWDKINWNRFVSIEFSCVVFAFAMRKALLINEELLVTNNESEKSLAELHKLGELYRKKLEGLKLLIHENINDGKTDLKRPECAKYLTNAYEFTVELYKNFYNEKNKPEFTKIMQRWADQIRQYGEIKLTDPNKDSIHPKYIARLPEAVRRIMKAYQTQGDKKFCIDAFRNPYEVEYFRRRYSEFYLVHLNRIREHRQLALKIFSDEQFKNLEEREQGKLIAEDAKIIDKTAKNIHEWFPSQNVNECAQKADYFINNVQDHQYYLRYHLIRLLALAHQPGCVPPIEDERSMQIATTARQMSGCISRQVGAVVVAPSGFVVGIGWNDPPKGQVPCSLRTGADLVHSPTTEVFSDYERSEKFVAHMKKIDCLDHAFCFKSEYEKSGGGKKAEYTRSLHAEENAFLQAVDHGGSALRGSTLYSTTIPCMLCAKKAYHLGVTRIVYVDAYSDIAIEQVIQAGAQKDRPAVVPFEGATGSAYFRLFSPIVPEKDMITLYSQRVQDSQPIHGTSGTP